MTMRPRHRTVAVAMPILVAVFALTACGKVSSGGGGASSAAGASLATRIIPTTAVQAQLAGHRPIVFLFVATGCASCFAEVAQLRQVMNGHPGVLTIGVDTVQQDTPHDLQSYLDEQDLADVPFTWTIDADGSLASRYGVAALGATVGLSASGAVRFRNPGPVDTAHLSSQLATLVET